MLSANNSKNESIIAFELTSDEIELKRKTEKFYCSCCKEEVSIINGKKKISHFSHKKSSDCPVSNESELHIKTKKSIYESLKAQGLTNVLLEKTFVLKDEIYQKYISLINDKCSHLNLEDTFFGQLIKRKVFRPDIIFQIKTGDIKNNIAVEIQKTNLPKEEFLLRTLFYKLLNINVLWIIPEKILSNKFIYDDFEQSHINITDFHKELKKYYFGNIYTWDYEKSQMSVYVFKDVTGYRTTGSMDGGYFEETGGYSFTYKKQKIIVRVYNQNNRFGSLESKEVKSNPKFNQLIDAKVWHLKYNTLKK